jgi:hypothetical protein
VVLCHPGAWLRVVRSRTLRRVNGGGGSRGVEEPAVRGLVWHNEELPVTCKVGIGMTREVQACWALLLGSELSKWEGSGEKRFGLKREF